jgi:hypothetical protein
VNQVRFHAQRQLLATCSDDRTARIWSLKDILARARGGVPTPSGSGGAAAAEDSPLVLRGHKNNVSTVDWCPAQPGGALLLATTSFDGTTRVWDGATGACLRTFADHKTPVFAVAFSPDGRWLATGGGDGFLFVYDVAVRAARGVRRVEGVGVLMRPSRSARSGGRGTRARSTTRTSARRRAPRASSRSTGSRSTAGTGWRSASRASTSPSSTSGACPSSTRSARARVLVGCLEDYIWDAWK